MRQSSTAEELKAISALRPIIGDRVYPVTAIAKVIYTDPAQCEWNDPPYLGDLNRVLATARAAGILIDARKHAISTGHNKYFVAERNLERLAREARTDISGATLIERIQIVMDDRIVNEERHKRTVAAYNDPEFGPAIITTEQEFRTHDCDIGDAYIETLIDDYTEQRHTR